MKPDVRVVIEENTISFFGSFDELQENIFLASIPFTDSLELIRKKTECLMSGLAKILMSERPPFTIYDIVNEKGQFKDLKFRKYDRNKYRWVYTDQRGVQRTSEYDTGKAHADIAYFTQLIQNRYNVPAESCTGILIGALVRNLTK